MNEEDLKNSVKLEVEILKKFTDNDDVRSKLLKIFKFLQRGAFSDIDEEIAVWRLNPDNYSEEYYKKSNINVKIRELKEKKQILSQFIYGSSKSILYFLLHHDHPLERPNSSMNLVDALNTIIPWIDVIEAGAYGENFHPETFIINIYFYLLTGAIDERYLGVPCQNIDNMSSLSKSKDIIDVIAEFEYFSEFDFSSLLLVMLEKLEKMNSLIRLNGYNKYLSDTLDTLDLLKKVGEDISQKSVIDVKEITNNKGSFSDTINYIIANRFSTLSKKIYYCSSLLYSNTLEYFQETLEERVEFLPIREEILKKIEGLNYDMFTYLDNLNANKGFSFKSCLETLFDSDTYVELENKLNILLAINDDYQKGNYARLNNLFDELNSSECLQVVGDTVISYNFNYQNLYQKPDSIYARSAFLYETLLGIRLNEIKNSATIGELNQKILEKLNQEQLTEKESVHSEDSLEKDSANNETPDVPKVKEKSKVIWPWTKR